MPIGQHILEQLKNNDPSLKKLNLTHQQLNDQDMVTLSYFLRSNLTLISLDIGGNPFTDAGILSLAECLRENKALKKLSIGACPNITDSGIIALAETLLEKNTTLTYIYMAANNISDKGVAALAQCKHLIAIDVQRTFITDNGANTLINSILLNDHKLSGIGLVPNSKVDLHPYQSTANTAALLKIVEEQKQINLNLQKQIDQLNQKIQQLQDKFADSDNNNNNKSPKDSTFFSQPPKEGAGQQDKLQLPEILHYQK